MCGKMKRVRLSSQVRKAFQRRSRGFTLIEVVIAIAILGTIAVTFLGALSTSSLALITADQRATAESLARSQMEFVKNQGYNSTLVGGQATYPKILGIPDGYSIYSVNSNNQTVNGGANDRVIGIAWNSTLNKPVTTDTGLQMIALVIKYQGKEIYTFINDNLNWANGVKITLEGYKRQPVT
jgi:prepilin-type N-terminal cleavage/methylation domain-containing protein